VVLLVIGVLVGGLLVAGCTVIVAAAVLFSGSDITDPFESAEFATIEEWPAAAGFAEDFQLDFPPSSRDIRIAADGFQDPIYQLRLSIDPDELPILVTSIGCNGLLSQPASEAPGSIIDDEVPWWTPASAEVYQECSGGATPGREQRVFVDLTDPDRTTVYVLVFYF